MPHDLVHIASRLFNVPLLVLPETAVTIATALAERIGVEPMAELGELRPHAATISIAGDDDEENDKPYQVVDRIAVLPVIGELINRGSWLSSISGLASYEALGNALRTAAEDPLVDGVLLDIDSPGGEASGAMEIAAVVREIDAIKPVEAFINGLGASAAYALASGASRITAAPSATLGSIGVVMLHMDLSKKLAESGRKPTLIFAGEYKTDGTSLFPLEEAPRSRLQSIVNDFYSLFVKTVAAHRPALSEQDVRNTKAGVYVGQAAVDAGLADATGTIDDVFSSLKDRRNPRIPNLGDLLMAESKTAPDGFIARAEHETILVQAAATSHAAAKEAVAAERKRISAILTSEEATGRETLAKHLAMETDMAPEAAITALKTSPKVEAQKTERNALEAAMDRAGLPHLAPDAGDGAAKTEFEKGAAFFAAARPDRTKAAQH